MRRRLTRPGSSVQVDNAEPEHDHVQDEEGDAEEPFRVVFDRKDGDLEAEEDARAEVLLPLRLQHAQLHRSGLDWLLLG